MQPVTDPNEICVWISHTAEDAGSSQKHGRSVWGLSPLERICRTLHIAGLTEQHIFIGPLPPSRPVTIWFRGDYVYDERLILNLVERGSLAIDNNPIALVDPTDESKVVALAIRGESKRLLQSIRGGENVFVEEIPGLRFYTPSSLISSYSPTLRNSIQPYIFRLRSEKRREIEDHIFDACYKGVTDIVTKFLWPKPARAVTRFLACAKIPPNAVTGVSWVLVIVATWLFSRGHFGFGLICAWGMTFLDTVDGKLARVTLNSSRVGHVLDHGLDLFHPPFWYFAWSSGLAQNVSPVLLLEDTVTAVIILGYVIGRVLEGIFIAAFKIEIHSWQRIDSLFRTVTARRNPNLILLSVGVLSGRPDLGFSAVAAWTLLSCLFHTFRLGQALIWRFRGRRIDNWQDRGLTQE